MQRTHQWQFHRDMWCIRSELRFGSLHRPCILLNLHHRGQNLAHNQYKRYQQQFDWDCMFDKIASHRCLRLLWIRYWHMTCIGYRRWLSKIFIWPTNLISKILQIFVLKNRCLDRQDIECIRFLCWHYLPDSLYILSDLLSSLLLDLLDIYCTNFLLQFHFANILCILSGHLFS